MHRRTLALLSVLLCACSPAKTGTAPRESETPTPEIPAATVITGQLLDHDGAPLPAAHVSVFRSNYRVMILDRDLAADGRFRVELPGPGAYTLRLAGVDHADDWLTIAVESGDVEINARLGTYPRTAPAESLRVRVRFVDGEGQAGEARELDAAAVEDRPQVYALALEPPPGARAVHYQIVDPLSGRSFNGPGGARWVYDGNGDFWAERSLDDQAEFLELDLGSLPPPERARTLDMHGEGLTISRKDEAWALLGEYSRRLHYDESKPKLERSEVCARVQAAALDARAAFEALDDTELRDAAAIEWAGFFGQFTRGDCIVGDDMRWVLELVAPEHPAWPFVGGMIANVFAPFPNDAPLQAYRRRLEAAQHDPGLHAQLLLSDLVAADQRGDSTAAQALYTKLSEDFVGSTPEFLARTNYNPDRPLQVGRTMPEWRFAGLDGGSVSSADLRGRPYLLEVWATWCGPCVEEMQTLHETFEALGGEQGLITFVSVNMDLALADIETFRRERWPMPWIHAYVQPTDHDALFEAWGFNGVPMPVLVDGEGMIVQVRDDLRGDKLLPTLEASFR